MVVLGLGRSHRGAASGHQLPHLRKIARDALIDGLQRVERLLPGKQGADVILQRLPFLPLPEGSDCFQSKSKGFHARLTGGTLAGVVVDIVCASAAQLCAVAKPWLMPWQRKAFSGSCD